MGGEGRGRGRGAERGRGEGRGGEAREGAGRGKRGEGVGVRSVTLLLQIPVSPISSSWINPDHFSCLPFFSSLDWDMFPLFSTWQWLLTLQFTTEPAPPPRSLPDSPRLGNPSSGVPEPPKL